MRIAVLNLTGGGISGGHKKYLANMLPLLSASDKVEAILCASPSTLEIENWMLPLPKMTCIPCEPFRLLRHSPDAALKIRLDEFQPDVLFISLERYIYYKGTPVVAMIQNMAPLAGAQTGCGIKEKLKSLARRYEAGMAVKHADAIIAPTDCVRDFIIKKFGVSNKKVSTIYYGYNPPHATAKPPAETRSMPEEFIFTAGSVEMYRGLEDLIRVLKPLQEKIPGIKLVVAGGARPGTISCFDRLKALARRCKVEKDIIWLGNVEEDHLSWCYSNCSVFVATSRIESFCFVALEAMSHGCNIVSTDCPCLPEILKDSAEYYRPGDITGLFKTMLEVLERDSSERSRFAATARTRASEFSWDTTARKTISLLEKFLLPDTTPA